MFSVIWPLPRGVPDFEVYQGSFTLIKRQWHRDPMSFPPWIWNSFARDDAFSHFYQAFSPGVEVEGHLKAVMEKERLFKNSLAPRVGGCDCVCLLAVGVVLGLGRLRRSPGTENKK